MKLKIMIVALMLLAGAQVSARDLSQMKNFRELEGLVYSKLPAAEQEQLLRLAVTSNLPGQLIAARGAISRHFKGINWNELVQINARSGFNGVKAKLGLTGMPTAPIVKTPAIVQIEKQQEQIQKEAEKAEQEAEKKEQIAEQKQAEKQKLLQKEQEQQAKTEAEIKQAEAEGKQKEAAELKKRLSEEKAKAAQEQAIIDAQIAENQKGSQLLQEQQERLKKEEEKLAQERAQQEKEAQKKIETFMQEITQLVNRINLMLGQKQAEQWFPAKKEELADARKAIANSKILQASEKSTLIQEVEKTIQALDDKLKAMQQEEAAGQLWEKSKQEISTFDNKVDAALKNPNIDLKTLEALNAEGGTLEENIIQDRGFSEAKNLEVQAKFVAIYSKIDARIEAIKKAQGKEAEQKQVQLKEVEYTYLPFFDIDEFKGRFDAKALQDPEGKIIKIIYGSKIYEPLYGLQPKDKTALGYWIVAQIMTASVADKKAIDSELVKANTAFREESGREIPKHASLFGYLRDGLIPVLKAKSAAFEGK